MTDLNNDPIINVIHNGIRRGIRIAIENNCYGSAVVLILSGIDTMAYIGMPRCREDVLPEDFIKWAERYVKFPCANQLSGIELYGARCGMLHSFSTRSKLSRKGKCRQVGYADRCVPEVVCNSNLSGELVIVSIEGLAKAFFDGMDRFLVDLYEDKEKAMLADTRFPWLVHAFPLMKTT